MGSWDAHSPTTSSPMSGSIFNDAAGRIHVREVKAPQSRAETARRGRSTRIRNPARSIDCVTIPLSASGGARICARRRSGDEEPSRPPPRARRQPPTGRPIRCSRNASSLPIDNTRVKWSTLESHLGSLFRGDGVLRPPGRPCVSASRCRRGRIRRCPRRGSAAYTASACWDAPTAPGAGRGTASPPGYRWTFGDAADPSSDPGPRGAG